MWGGGAPPDVAIRLLASSSSCRCYVHSSTSSSSSMFIILSVPTFAPRLWPWNSTKNFIWDRPVHYLLTTALRRCSTALCSVVVVRNFLSSRSCQITATDSRLMAAANWREKKGAAAGSHFPVQCPPNQRRRPDLCFSF